MLKVAFRPGHGAGVELLRLPERLPRRQDLGGTFAAK
jgi:hypothetical protein